ncbi:MAG: polysaccharide biosynthesis C-terminal domain-containing protein [Hungatella sp.]|jgi:Na+-driven multidrug efflux pump|nr:polysaccharide biosynthesis C-terminal domain-containing protein [Hungatella sp.]
MQSNILKQSTEQRRDLILNGAVTYCTLIVNIISALAQGVSVAGMAIIGQSNGNGDFKHSRKISTQIIVFTFLLGFLLAPLLIALAFPISTHVNKEISHDVFVYLALSACVTPFSFMESIYNSIRNANGKPEDTFVRMVIMLILKIIFSALFIMVFRWGLVGSVMASLASNFLITVWMYYELFLKETGEPFVLTGFRFDCTIINTLLRIGFPVMLFSGLRHKCHYCRPFDRPGGASVFQTYGVIYKGCLCPFRGKPGGTYLYWQRNIF